MADKEIRQTIRLDGEKEYNAALREAQRNLKTLRSELKAETAELGANATQQQKNEARARSLQKQIKEQEKVVETLKKALEEAKQQYGDNEDVVQRWEQRLNNARATLGGMRNDLSGLEQSYAGVNQATEAGVVATRSFAESVQSIASMGESVSTAIENIFTGMVDTVRDIVVDLWDMISETAAKADNYSDVAGYWGTDPATIQKWSNALSASGKDLETYQQIVTRLALGGKNKNIAEMLGISDVNYEDQWSYAIAVMSRLSELSKTSSIPDNFWETVFGEKKAVKAMEYVNAWDAITAKLELYDADNGGIGMTSEGIDTYAKIFEQINTAQTSWDALKDSIAEGLGETVLSLMVNVNGGLKALSDILNADTAQEREAAIQQFEKEVTELFEKVGAAIKVAVETLGTVGEELANSDDPIVSAIGNIMKDLANALQWMADNAEDVKKALETIFGVWLVGRLGKIGGQISAILANIAVIKSFSAMEGAGAAAAGAGAGAAGAGAAGAAGTGTAGAAGVAAGGSILGGLAGLISIVAGLAWARNERLTNENIRGSEGAIQQEIGDNEQLESTFVEWISANQMLQEKLDEGLIDTEETAELFREVDTLNQKLHEMEGGDEALSAYSDWKQERSLGNQEWVMPDYLYTSRDDVVSQVTSVNTSVDDVGTKIDATKDEVVKAARENARWYASHVDNLRVVLDGQLVGRIVGAGIARDAVQ